MIFFFFFSSRRRHTRSKRDWSSDVCSSDLPASRCWCERLLDDEDRRCRSRSTSRRRCGSTPPAAPWSKSKARSEERRVGKECRSRWSTKHEKKNKKSKSWVSWIQWIG